MPETRDLKRAVSARFVSGVLFFAAIFFGSAGTLRYWQAWAFMAALFTPMLGAFAFFLRHDPQLLARRLQAREERPRQKTIVALVSLLWIVGFVLPGLDHRFGWSAVPTPLVLLADAVVFGGYLIVLRVLVENSYASRTIRVEEDQVVITTGPYALVRHPMYVGVALMLIAAPVALGSYWALIPAMATPVFLVLRVQDEEEALLDELPGYEEYARQTRYRLVPGVW